MNFNEFTKVNQVIKAARFELNPVGATREYLEKHGVIEGDAIRKSNANLAREISDDFIKGFLQTVGLSGYNWAELAELFGTSEYRSGAEEMKKKIAKDITAQFKDYINSYTKKNNCNSTVSFPGAGFVEVLLSIYASNTEKFCTPEYREALKSLKGASTALFK